jgi:hypothetical protein
MQKQFITFVFPIMFVQQTDFLKRPNLVLAGALQKEDYLANIQQAGLKVNIIDDDKEICKTNITDKLLRVSRLRQQSEIILFAHLFIMTDQ